MLTRGQTLSFEFLLHDPSLAGLVDNDGSPGTDPAGVLVRNGVATAETVTVSRISTGIFKAVAVIPDDWEAGDCVQVRASATVDGIADADEVFTTTLSPTLEEIAAAVVAALGTVTVNVNGAMSATGELSINQGDSYLFEDSRHIPVSVTGTFPSFSGATVTLHLQSSDEIVIADGVVVTATGGTRVFRFDLTEAQTASLPEGVGQWEVQVELATSGNTLTPVYGTLNVRKQIA